MGGALASAAPAVVGPSGLAAAPVGAEAATPLPLSETDTRFARLDGPDGSPRPGRAEFEAAWDRAGVGASRPQVGAPGHADSAAAVVSAAHRVGGADESVGASVALAKPDVAVAVVVVVPVAAVARVVPVVRVDAFADVESAPGQQQAEGAVVAVVEEEEERAVTPGNWAVWRARPEKYPMPLAVRELYARPEINGVAVVVPVDAVDEVLAVAAAHPDGAPSKHPRKARPAPPEAVLAKDSRNAVERVAAADVKAAPVTLPADVPKRDDGANPTVNGAETPSVGSSTVSFDGELSDDVVASTVATPLGRYTQLALEVVNSRWYDEELPLAQRVAGVEGSVLVRFDVSRNGRVNGVKLLRRSGFASLDRMALRAVPSRLPELPDDVDGAIRQQVSFRYVNPFSSLE